MFRKTRVLTIYLYIIDVSAVIFLFYHIKVFGLYIDNVSGFVFWFVLSTLVTLSIVPLPAGHGVATSLGDIVDIACIACIGPYPVLAANIVGLLGRGLILGGMSIRKILFNLF